LKTDQFRTRALVSAIIVSVAVLCGCGPDDEHTVGDYRSDAQKKWESAMTDLRAGIGVPATAAYDGGTVPHKVNKVYMDGLSMPDEWVTSYWGLEELQLALFYDETTSDTGRIQAFYFIDQRIYVKLQHLVYSFTLRKGRTGEVMGTFTVEGDRKFKSTYETSFNTREDATIIGYDTVNFAPVIEWLRPFVE